VASCPLRGNLSFMASCPHRGKVVFGGKLSFLGQVCPSRGKLSSVEIYPSRSRGKVSLSGKLTSDASVLPVLRLLCLPSSSVIKLRSKDDSAWSTPPYIHDRKLVPHCRAANQVARFTRTIAVPKCLRPMIRRLTRTIE